VTKTLRVLILPFVALYVVMAALTLGKAHVVHQGASWQIQMVALAFVIVLSGLGWTECANDYSRYLPEERLQARHRSAGFCWRRRAPDPAHAARGGGGQLTCRAWPATR